MTTAGIITNDASVKFYDAQNGTWLAEPLIPPSCIGFEDPLGMRPKARDVPSRLPSMVLLAAEFLALADFKTAGLVVKLPRERVAELMIGKIICD